MNAKEFYERVDQARGDLSFKKFFENREGFEEKLATSYRMSKIRGTLPTVDTIILVADLFTEAEIFGILHSRLGMQGIKDDEEEKTTAYLLEHHREYYRKWKRLKAKVIRIRLYDVLGG